MQNPKSICRVTGRYSYMIEIEQNLPSGNVAYTPPTFLRFAVHPREGKKVEQAIRTWLDAATNPAKVCLIFTSPHDNNTISLQIDERPLVVFRPLDGAPEGLAEQLEAVLGNVRYYDADGEELDEPCQ